MTLSELTPGDTFAFPSQQTRFILKAHREGNEIRRPYVDCIELDRFGQHRKSRCFAPDRAVRLVERAA
jgi:hypothetical protein